MSNIYLIFIEKIWCSQIFNFVSLKNLSPGQFWRAQTQEDIEFQNLLLQLKNQRHGSKTMCGFSITLILNEIMTL